MARETAKPGGRGARKDVDPKSGALDHYVEAEDFRAQRPSFDVVRKVMADVAVERRSFSIGILLVVTGTAAPATAGSVGRTLAVVTADDLRRLPVAVPGLRPELPGPPAHRIGFEQRVLTGSIPLPKFEFALLLVNADHDRVGWRHPLGRHL